MKKKIHFNSACLHIFQVKFKLYNILNYIYKLYFHILSAYPHIFILYADFVSSLLFSELLLPILFFVFLLLHQ